MNTVTTAAALYSNKANTRMVLCASLAERNAEVVALRNELSIARGAGQPTRPAPKVIARSEFSTRLDEHMRSMKERVAVYMKANPQARSVTKTELEEFEYLAG